MKKPDCIIVTGSAGLIGSETSKLFASRCYRIIGIDNDMRRTYFGPTASTKWNRRHLLDTLPSYTHLDADIRDYDSLERVFETYSKRIALIVHTAAQPSHDWAAREPLTDFSVNANGTLNLLELTRHYAPEAPFIFTSTNKVYGDAPNSLPLTERKSRWELASDHAYFNHGVDETMTIDQSMHSLFGASKIAADILVQEYGRYFGLNTACFRAGCLTGPAHSATALHGFLAYLMKCAATGQEYTVHGYQGKQVRDNIHSVDLVRAFWSYFENPRPAAVYNIGGGRACHCSMLEAIELCTAITGKPFNWTYCDQNRRGDHKWWVSDSGRFKTHYPQWSVSRTVPQILEEIFNTNRKRWQEEGLAHA
jgi:CDP-paratose 2-epimerase